MQMSENIFDRYIHVRTVTSSLVCTFLSRSFLFFGNLCFNQMEASAKSANYITRC